MLRTEAVIGGVVDLIIANLKKGSRIRISGAGSLSIRKRRARMGRNPATGEAIKIKAAMSVSFRPAKNLRSLSSEISTDSHENPKTIIEKKHLAVK